MSRSKKEATIIVLDVGENTLVTSGKTGLSFFERAKACVSKIIQKKIFGKPGDEIGLILMGSNETQNDLNSSQLGFDHITEKIMLQVPTWEMIRTVENIEYSDFSSDWIDGLVVALNFAKNETGAKKFSNVRILLITNFTTSVDDDNIDVVVNATKDANVELLAISDCVEHFDLLRNSRFSQDPNKNASQTRSQMLCSKVIQQVEGHMCHIDQAEAQLLTFQKKHVNSMPWNASLKIGSRLDIPISAYVYIQEEKFLASFKTESHMSNTVTKMVTEYTKNNQVIEKPDENDIIRAYQYGPTMVAVDEDLSVETEKGLALLGFINKESMQDEYFSGQGCHLVLPRKDAIKGTKFFKALVVNLIALDQIIIATKVYRNNTNPILVALLPLLIDDVPTMTMIQFAFANDVHMETFSQLRIKKNTPTDEQEKIMDDLVDKMDLMVGCDDGSGVSEAFALETSLNPVNQHLCRSVAFRALHPSEPLPKIDPELAAMIDVPPKIKENVRTLMTEIEKQFPLEIIEKKRKKVFGKRNTDAMEGDDDEPVETDGEDTKRIIEVGTVNPAEDFEYLLKNGHQFGKISEQLQNVISDLIFRCATLQHEKILLSIMMYRDKAKVFMPFDYNKWLKELKATLIERERTDFWENVIIKEGLGLITINEAPISKVTIEEQLEFYEVPKANLLQTSAMVVDDDLDDLLG